MVTISEVASSVIKYTKDALTAEELTEFIEFIWQEWKDEDSFEPVLSHSWERFYKASLTTDRSK